MRFNYLHIPNQWQHYWTKYPEGYTILEALFDWLNQVNKMVDNQNTLNQTVESFRKEMDETYTGFRKELDSFLTMFDPKLQNTVIEVLEDWQKSGFLDIVIDAALQTKIDDIQEYYWKSNLTGLVDPTTLLPEQIYTIAEAYSHPYMVTGSWGKDESGTCNVRFWRYTPPNYETTIFITAGLHGGECYGPYFLAHLFKMLATNDSQHLPRQMQYLKEKVRILAMPFVNPWGAYQEPKTRFNFNGVDLNRNFDYLWDSQTSYEPFEGGYKGESAFSEVETKYVKQVFDTYKIDAFMDLHDYINGVGKLDYVFYGDSQTETILRELLAYWTKRVNPEEGILSTVQDQSTVNNYASQVMGIPSVNIEGLPGAFSTVGSGEDINLNFEMYGNGLKLMATHFKQPKLTTFSMTEQMGDYLDSEIVVTTDTEIENATYSFTPNTDGYVFVNGFVLGKNTTETDIFSIKAFLEQEGFITQNDGTPTPIAWKSPYTTGKYPLLPLNNSIPVVKGKEVTFKILATNEGTGTCHFKRFNYRLTFTGATDSKEFTFMKGHTFTRTGTSYNA